MKSVFISSTSKDLGAYRAAVKAAIERLDLRPIDMHNFGSQPGGASGVSVREVGKADIFVGILARRYGYVPEGMSKSVTEQEYDEAVRRRLPRLMYLLDEDFDWDAALVENDPTAQERLATFRQRVEANEVRSLFTTPENLAQQVTADLVKLLDKQRQQATLTRILAAALTLIALIALVLVVNPAVMDEGKRIVGIVQPDTDGNGNLHADLHADQHPHANQYANSDRYRHADADRARRYAIPRRSGRRGAGGFSE